MPNVEDILASQGEAKQNASTQDDLRKEIERLRMEVEMASRSIVIDENDCPVESLIPPEAIAKGFNSPEDFTIKDGSLRYSDGSSYEGERLGALRHGKGTYTRADGATYKGEWRYDVLEGHARAVMPDGQTYDGPWKEGRACGRGRATYQGGAVYEGDFENDGRHGWGIQTFPTSDTYEGEWFQDKIHGQGRWTYPDGSFYEGEWTEGQRIRGRLLAVDGSEEYSGEWKGDKRHGQGVQYRRGVFKYAGEWQDDLQHGKGRCIYVDNSVYDGDWAKGQREGTGKFTSSDGSKYDGEWKSDFFDGKGCLLDESGNRYVGNFVRGVKEGLGRCLYADGHKYEGQWHQGKRHGRGTCVFANGDVYKGDWNHDKRHGRGVCRFADGVVFRGEWEDDAWVQSGADPSLCIVAGPGVTTATAGREAKFKVLAKDHDGNRRLDGSDEFQVMLTLIPDRTRDDVDDTLDDCWADESVAEKDRGGRSEAVRRAEDNEEEEEEEDVGSEKERQTNIKLMVTKQDEVPQDLHDTCMTSYESRRDVAVPIVRITASVQDNDDGTYDVTYIAEKSGIYELQILLGGNEHVADSPYPVRVESADPDPRKIVVRGPGRSFAIASKEANFEVIARDAFGNRYHGNKDALSKAMSALEVSLECSNALTSTDASIAVAIEPTSDGRLVCTYRAPDQSCYCRLHFLFDGNPLPGTPFAVRVFTQEQYDAFRSQEAAAESVKESPANGINGKRRDAQLNDHKEHAIKDQNAVWERIAAAAYAADGIMEGWDSDNDETVRRGNSNSAEEAYMKSHPDVPVVENLEDLWLVSKLQQERKAKEEQRKMEKLEKLRSDLESRYGPGEAPPGEEETMQALREILEQEKTKPKESASVKEEAYSLKGNDPKADASTFSMQAFCAGPPWKTRTELLHAVESLDEIS